MFEVEAPRSKDEIGTALAVLSHELERYLEGFSNEEFYAPQGEHWSPAEHVRHLTKSVRAVARGMRQPRLLLRLMFGLADDHSRGFSELLEVYRQKLADGATAGRFTPSPNKRGRDAIMEHWHIASKQLNLALASWSEEELGVYRLPHPLLGKLTVREMLLFTVFHNAHHAGRIRERAGDRTADLAPGPREATPRSANPGIAVREAREPR